MPTIEEIMQHLGIDYADDDILANVTSALEDAVSFLKGAVGDDVLDLMPDDRRVARLIKVYAKEIYDERGTGAKAGSAKRDMVTSMELQLKMELIRKREEPIKEEAETYGW